MAPRRRRDPFACGQLSIRLLGWLNAVAALDVLGFTIAHWSDVAGGAVTGLVGVSFDLGHGYERGT